MEVVELLPSDLRPSSGVRGAQTLLPAAQSMATVTQGVVLKRILVQIYQICQKVDLFYSYSI